MELFDQPVPLAQAVKILQQKGLLPTDLTSAQLKDLAAALRNQSLFSAQTTMTDLLAKYKTVINSILSPEQVNGVTKGFNPQTARQAIQQLLKSVNYTPAEGTAGSLLDLSSFSRINLVVHTNSELAWGAGQFLQQNSDPDLVDLWPAAELFRLQEKKVPRDWVSRWTLAAQESGDASALAALGQDGSLIALKSSPLWQALGDGAGGFDDTLGNPFPPFAFNSGMWTRDVSRADAEAYGLLDPGAPAKPAPYDLATLFKTPSLKEAA